MAPEFTSQIKLSAIPFSRLRFSDLIELDPPPFEVRIGVVFFRSRHSPDDGLPLLSCEMELFATHRKDALESQIWASQTAWRPMKEEDRSLTVQGR